MVELAQYDDVEITAVFAKGYHTRVAGPKEEISGGFRRNLTIPTDDHYTCRPAHQSRHAAAVPCPEAPDAFAEAFKKAWDILDPSHERARAKHRGRTH